MIGPDRAILERVWINGKLLGDSPGAGFDLDAHGGTMDPFEMDVTSAVRFGAKNVVAVRVNRNRPNEIGSGGILGPAKFYAPPRQTKEDSK